MHRNAKNHAVYLHCHEGRSDLLLRFRATTLGLSNRPVFNIWTNACAAMYNSLTDSSSPKKISLMFFMFFTSLYTEYVLEDQDLGS